MQQHRQFEGVNGLLYYMHMNKLIEVKFKNHEVLSIINKRNVLAKHYKRIEKLKEATYFPPMINSPHECSRCYQNVTCALVNLTLEEKINQPGNKEKKRLHSQKSLPDLEDFQVDPSFKKYYEIEGKC